MTVSYTHLDVYKRQLYALAGAYLDVVAVLVLADTFHHVGAGVVPVSYTHLIIK